MSFRLVSLVFALVLIGHPLPAQQPATSTSRTALHAGSALPAATGQVAVEHSANPGRSLPTANEVGPPRPGRFVGIFYFLTHTEGPRHGHPEEPLNIAKILQQDPDALKKPDSPLWGHEAEPHYWGEPLYGYYHSADPWVLQRHAQLLADAGVDVMIFDTTNAISYPEVYLQILKSFAQVRREGGHTPQVAFMVNTEAGKTAQDIYNTLYKPGLYRDLWFLWQGKPLMICDPAEANETLRSFFTLRGAHWPFTMENTAYAWHWEATYPQPFGYTEDPTHPEQLNVSVAQNLRADDGKVTNMSDGLARGRSFHDGQQHIAPGSVDRGYNFQEQWKRAFELDPPFVMITGWNEWTAGRFSRPGKPIVFVDQFDEEFSRDIEPQKGGHRDNYYYQMIANIRRYKGVPPVPAASSPVTIKIDGPFAQWSDVAPEFAPEPGASLARDFPGVGGLHYTNKTLRNEFQSFKVARDRDYLYFYARTREAITLPRDAAWMWLFIDADRNAKTGWSGYDFVVNRTFDSKGQTWLERNTGGWHWEKVAPVRLRVEGNQMQLAIPRSALGLPAHAEDASLDFKWADNLQQPGDVLDFYLDGDVAPAGRFNFRFEGR